MRTEQSRLADEHQKVSKELDAARARLQEAEGTTAEIVTLKDERDLIRLASAHCWSSSRDSTSRARHGRGSGAGTNLRAALSDPERARPPVRQELASYVDERMRAAADQSPAGDSLRLAVLAALNIADEAFRVLDAEDGRPASLSARLAAIERLIDEALAAESGSLDPPRPSF